MPQFRLTAKMAKELKIDTLSEPKTDLPNFYDDWYMDITHVARKKVVLAMHIKTRMGIAILLSDIGGLKHLFSFFPFILNHHLYACHLDNYKALSTEINAFYGLKKENHIFTKTKSGSVTAHMTQFKQVLEANAFHYGGGVMNQKLCDHMSHSWLEWLIKRPDSKNDYTRPKTLWQEEYNARSLLRLSNVAHLFSKSTHKMSLSSLKLGVFQFVHPQNCMILSHFQI